MVSPLLPELLGIKTTFPGHGHQLNMTKGQPWPGAGLRAGHVPGLTMTKGWQWPMFGYSHRDQW